jgi:hypothetical protein
MKPEDRAQVNIMMEEERAAAGRLGSKELELFRNDEEEVCSQANVLTANNACCCRCRVGIATLAAVTTPCRYCMSSWAQERVSRWMCQVELSCWCLRGVCGMNRVGLTSGSIHGCGCQQEPTCT